VSPPAPGQIVPGTYSGTESPVTVDYSKFPWRTQASLAVDPTDDQVVYVGVEHEGIFKSVNGGVAWSRVTNNIPGRPNADGSGPVYSEFYMTGVSPQNPGIVYTCLAASPGTVASYPSSREGVYRSADGGASWAHAVSSTMNTAIYCVAVDPTNPNIVYAGCNGNTASYTGADPNQYFNTIGSIYKSTDGGSTWTELDTGFVPGLCVNYLEISPSDPRIVYASTFILVKVPGQASYYASTQYGVLKSTDGGATWASKTNGMDLSQPGTRALWRTRVSPRDSNRLFACSYQSSMYYSADGGESFQAPSGGGYKSVFVWDPNDAEGDRMLAVDGMDVLKSEDGGATFSVWGVLPYEARSTTPGIPPTVQISDMEWSRQDPGVVYMSGSYGRVYKSADGGVSWATMLTKDSLPD